MAVKKTSKSAEGLRCGFCGGRAAIFAADRPLDVDGKLYCGRCPIEHTHAAGQSESFPEGVTHSHEGSTPILIGGQVVSGFFPDGYNHGHSTMRFGG